jgi:anti-sigma B factor antagonist
MFSVTIDPNGDILLAGRFDATRVDEAYLVLDTIADSRRVNFKNLDYISSAGLGALLKTQKRISSSGHQLTLTNMNKLIRDVFKIARFDVVFKIEEPV